MTGLRGRKVHVVNIGGEARNAYSTSIAYSLTLDDLMHAIAVAATTLAEPDERFEGGLSHSPVADEYYWSEADTAAARRAARSIGPGRVYAAARAELRAHGEAWRSSEWENTFPPDAARGRAEELFPMLVAGADNPFAPVATPDDR